VMSAIGSPPTRRRIIADEPDNRARVTIKHKILELMKDLCRRLGIALIIITPQSRRGPSAMPPGER